MSPHSPGKVPGTYAYSTYGFDLYSNWKLPEGVPRLDGDQRTDDGIATLDTLDVRHGHVQWPHLSGDGEAVRFSPSSHQMFWPILGRVSIGRDGCTVVDPQSSAPRGIVQHAILGPIAAHWLHMQGYLALHANCVNIGGELIAVAGASGAGKSSLSAALVAQGALPHSDDVLAIQPETCLSPFGSSRIKLNPDVLEGLSLRDCTSAPVYDGVNKQSVALPLPADLSAKKLKVVYRLKDAPQGSAPELTEVNGFLAALSIFSEIFRVHVAKDAFGAQPLLDRCASLIGTVRVFELRRPKELCQIQNLAEILGAHAASLSG